MGGGSTVEVAGARTPASTRLALPATFYYRAARILAVPLQAQMCLAY